MASHMLQSILSSFEISKTTASEFVLSMLKDAKYENHPCTEDLVRNSKNILEAFLEHPQSSETTFIWANNIMKRKYAEDIRDLADKDNRWHFGASHATESKLRNFRVEDMARKMQHMAPELWDLLGVILSANRRQPSMVHQADKPLSSMDIAQIGDDVDGVAYWKDVEDIEADDIDEKDVPDRMANRRHALITIVRAMSY
jgi:hypothetical protein